MNLIQRKILDCVALIQISQQIKMNLSRKTGYLMILILKFIFKILYYILYYIFQFSLYHHYHLNVICDSIIKSKVCNMIFVRSAYLQ